MKFFKAVFFVLFLVFAFCFIVSFVYSASLYSLGNISRDIQTSYYYGENLKGWINISFRNAPFNSLFTFYNSNISVYDLLTNVNSFYQGNQFNCSTEECGMTYDSSDNGELNKSFNLAAEDSKVLGLKAADEDSIQFRKLEINFSSDASESCSNQLSINIGDDENGFKWSNSNSDASFCGSENYGCYSSSSSSTDLMPNTEYCEMIQIDSAPALLVGADVMGTGSAQFRFSVEDNSCTNTIASSGKVSCRLNVSISEPTNISVCMSQVSGSYKLYYERNSPVCGESNGNTNYDFSIFAKPFKF